MGWEKELYEIWVGLGVRVWGKGENRERSGDKDLGEDLKSLGGRDLGRGLGRDLET